MDAFYDNLHSRDVLQFIKKHISDEESQVHKRNCKEALNLACEYYCDIKLKQNDVRPIKLVDLEGIERNGKVNIILYEAKIPGRIQDLYNS